MDKKSLSESAQAFNPELLRKGLAKVKWDKNSKNLQSNRLYQTQQYLYYLIVEPDGLKLQIILLNEKLEEEIVPIIYQQSSATSLFDIEIANEMLLLKEKYFSISGFLVTKKLSIGRIERVEIILAMFQSDELIQADFHTFNNLKYIGALTPPNYSRYPKQYDQKFHIFKLGQELPIFTISINLWTQQQFTSFSFSAPGDENESIIYFCNLKGAIYQLILPLPELFVNHSTFNYIQDRFAKGPIYDTINLTQKKIKDRIVCNFEPLEKWEHHVEFTEIQISQYSDLIEDYQCYLISKCQQNFLYTVHIKDANSILILAYLWDEEEKVYQNFYSDQISTYKQNSTTDLKTLQFSLPERILFKQLSQRQKFYMNPLKNTEIVSYQNNLILIDYYNLTNQSKENAVSIYCASFKVKQAELDFKQVAIISFKDERNIVIIQGDQWRILDKNQIQKIKNQKLKQQIFDEQNANNQTSSQYWEDFNKLDLMSQQLKIVRDQLMKIQEVEVIEDLESETENVEIGCNFEDYNDVKESGKFDNAPTFDFEDVVENRASKFEPKFKGKLEENSSKLKSNQSQEQMSVQQSKKSKEQQPQYYYLEQGD